MIYLDNCATSGNKNECVISAVVNALKYYSANAGRASHSMALKCAMLVQETRTNLANFIGLKNGNIAFCLNCSQALNYAIIGTVVPHGHVITTAYEHNSVLRPLHELQRKGLISLTILPPNELGFVSETAIENAIKDNTYLVATNHISNVTGGQTPIKKIGKLCKNRGILYLVDGAQSAGHVPLLMDEYFIDLLALAPHKALNAPQGIGALAIGENVQIQPLIYGGTGTESNNIFQPKELPESLETGTLPLPAIAGLNASLSWTSANQKIDCAKIMALTKYLYSHIQDNQKVKIYSVKNNESGIVSFNIGTLHSSDVATILSDHYDIAVRGGLHCAPLIHKHLNTLNQGIVRCSVSAYNSFAELDHLIMAINEIASSE